MIHLLNNLAIVIGYAVLTLNAAAGTLIIASMWIDGIRDWFQRRRDERAVREARWVPDEITQRRQMRSKVG